MKYFDLIMHHRDINKSFEVAIGIVYADNTVRVDWFDLVRYQEFYADLDALLERYNFNKEFPKFLPYLEIVWSNNEAL